MKTKLLRIIRSELRNKITINSVTRTTDYSGSYITGMSYSYSKECYAGLFSFGDTKEGVLRKVEKIGWQNNKEYYRKKYQKYTRLYKLKNK